MDYVERRRALHCLVSASSVVQGERPRGLVVVAPNNSGKTHYARRHPHWHDHDVLFRKETGTGQKLEMSEEDMHAADRVTARHRAMGDDMLVATWWDPRLIDAFVIIPQSTLEGRGLSEEKLRENTRQAKKYRTIAKKYGIPIYPSFEKADAVLRAPKPSG